MLSRLSIRANSSAAAAAPNTLAASFDLRSSRLPSGLSVTSVDLGQPIAHLSIAFRAGSRYESVAESGFAHRLRNALGGDSRRAKGLTMLWQSGAIGADVKATADRENVVLSMSFPRSNTALGASLLSELAQPKLEAWELEDSLDSLKTDLAHLPVWEKVSQLLHEAAYRNGPLANSPYLREGACGSADYRQLQRFANSRLVAGEGAVVGVNVDHGELQSFFAERAFILDGKGKEAVPSAYHGHGEVRRDGPMGVVSVAVAGEAPSLSNTKGLAAAAVVAEIAKSALPVCASFYQPYADSGLLGFYVHDKASSSSADRVKKAVSSFKSLHSNIDASSLKAAKAAAKIAVLDKADRGAELTTALATSILAPGKELLTPSDLASAIDGVSLEEAKETARVAGARLSLAAYGNVRHVPYLDEC